MNVTAKKLESADSPGERKSHTLVASKGFKAGDIIYTVIDSPSYIMDADLTGS